MAGEARDLTPKVVIKDVKKIYDGRNGPVVALNGANLEIRNNEFICVVGPSGCGKSTLLNILAGLLEPTPAKCWWTESPWRAPALTGASCSSTSPCSPGLP